MTKRKKEKPVVPQNRVSAFHVEKRECWCNPVWVSGRFTGGALLHRQSKDEPATLRLDAANGVRA